MPAQAFADPDPFNRAENSHQPTRERERRMRGFRTPERTQMFLSSFGLINVTEPQGDQGLAARTLRVSSRPDPIARPASASERRSPSFG